MDCSTPGLPVHHQLPEFTQAHVHWVSDTIQPSHALSSPSSPTFNFSQHQSLFKWKLTLESSFFFFILLLYNTVLVLPYINMNLPRVYMSSQSWTPLPLPSPYHLSGSSQCTSPKHKKYILYYFFNFLFQLPTFVKHNVGLSLGNEENTTALFATCLWTE